MYRNNNSCYIQTTHKDQYPLEMKYDESDTSWIIEPSSPLSFASIGVIKRVRKYLATTLCDSGNQHQIPAIKNLNVTYVRYEETAEKMRPHKRRHGFQCIRLDLIMAMFVIFLAGIEYILTSTIGWPICTGACILQIATAPLYSVTLVMLKFKTTRAFGLLMSIALVIVYSTTIGEALVNGDIISCIINVITSALFLLSGYYFFIRESLALAYDDHHIRSATTAESLILAWTFIHAAAIFVVIISTTVSFGIAFVILVAISMPLPIFSITRWKPERGNIFDIIIEVIAFVSAFGQILCGCILYPILYGSVSTTVSEIFGMIRIYCAIILSALLCIPHGLRPFIQKLGKRKIIVNLISGEGIF